MRNVLLIDKGRSSVYNFERPLEDAGYFLTKARSTKEALSYLKKGNIDLIIIDRIFSSCANDFKEFRRLTKDIPKIVFSSSKTFRGMGVWVKDRLTAPVYEPLSFKELEYQLGKLIEEKSIREESQRLETELRLQKKELSFFEEISKTLTSALELKDILNTIMEKTKMMTKAEAWSILLVDEETGELVFEKISGKEARKIQKFRLKMGEGIAGWVAKEGIPIVVPDVSNDPRFSCKVDRSIHFRTKSLMCVPIKSKNKTLGVIEVVNKTTGEPFTKADLDLLLKLVDHAAVAIERASLYQKMTEMAITDDLTKLFNLRYLNRTIETEIERSNRYGSSVSTIFMDLDYFKNVNDQHGHIAGSKVLVETAQLLLRGLRTVDIVARYGGDEFVIVLPQTSPRSAFQIAERLRKAIEQHVFLKKEGYPLKLTASFGIASYPENAKSKDELIHLADEAMYKVKYATRNGVYAIATG
ncbi:MAG: diguanylate cyclase [Nitrospirae bacterium]|nr:diguanylate cyclase [Nitrospirota bacterium]